MKLYHDKVPGCNLPRLSRSRYTWGYGDKRATIGTAGVSAQCFGHLFTVLSSQRLKVLREFSRRLNVAATERQAVLEEAKATS